MLSRLKCLEANPFLLLQAVEEEEEEEEEEGEEGEGEEEEEEEAVEQSLFCLLKWPLLASGSFF